MVKVRESIFGSRWERRLFTALDSAWPKKLDIYPNLPFLSVFDWSGIRVSEKERSFLKATSIDYTVCLHGSDKPVLSVEFDGMGHGYSRGSQYIQFVQTNDPFRAEKLALKLKIAEGLFYPLFVVSYDEAGELVENDRLSIAHGIVGDCMKQRFMQSAIDERAREIDFSAYPSDEQDLIAQNILVDVETELEFEWNPLFRAAACAMSDALDAGMKSFSTMGLTDPPLPLLDSEPSIGDIRRNITLMFAAKRHGSRITAEGDEIRVTREVWVRNIQGPGVHGFSLVDDVAKLLCFRDYIRTAKGSVTTGRHWP